MGSNSEIIIYMTGNKETQIEVKVENETVWLTQKPFNSEL